MKEKYLYLVYSVVIILMLALAGCVAPPKETPATPVDLHNSNLAANNSSTKSFVTEVTLSDYTQSTIQPAGYNTLIPQTQIPADITCRIHGIDLYGYNGSAFTFDLKNPPMYINYTIVPKNVTVNRTYQDNTATKKKYVTLQYSDYSPNSWFEITVRDSATNEIILKDGFGETKGYATYLNRTLKVMKTGNILVEFRSNDMKKAAATIWVKPSGNFEESRLSEFTNCMYWDAHRDTLAAGKTTTIKAIYTWTVENKVTK